jgi:hypothetical protein
MHERMYAHAGHSHGVSTQPDRTRATQPTRLVICSKSRWEPAIRREHELARLAVDAGHEVVFVERPFDVRAIRSLGLVRWAKRLFWPASRDESGVQVVSRSTLAPGHRGVIVGLVDQVLLGRALARWRASILVVSAPWDWPAAARAGATRTVFDCADDWAIVLDRDRRRLRRLYAAAGTQADVIICASPTLSALFPKRDVAVVRNGTPSAMLDAPVTPRPGTRAMVYAGTLSGRFDTGLIAETLARLPGWRLRIFGQAQYPGLGDQPDAALTALLERFGDRIEWNGALPRDQVSGELDAGDVLVIPHRTTGANTGDSMKFYDYAAAGRPIVTSRWSSSVDATAPPHTYIADTADEFAAAVLGAASEPGHYASDRREWAEEARWTTRWNEWSAAALA